MPLFYYIQISVTGLAITLIISFHMLRHKNHKTSTQKIFWSLIISNMMLLLLEMLLNIFTGGTSAEARALLPAIVLIFYIMNPVPEALWVLYLDAIIRREKKSRNKALMVLVSLPVLLNLFSALLSLSEGWLFFIDSQNVYHRGPYFWILLLNCYGYLVYNIVLIFLKRRSIPRQEFWVAFFAALLPVIAGALQSLFFGISLIWIALSFSLLIAYMNLQNEQIYKELMVLDKLKDEFLAHTAHELRMPLKGIINILNSVLERGNEKDGGKAQELRVAVSCASRLDNLINDISDLSSLRNGRLKLHMRAVDIRSIAEVTLYMLSRLKGNKEIEFSNDIPETMPPVYGDAERLYQIFYNLVENALKFTGQGRVSVGAAVEQGQARIWVKDTGCGMKADDLERLLKTAGPDETLPLAEGGGMGLFITRGLIELQNGRLEAVSEKGKGSCFTFTLPLSEEKGEPVVRENTLSLTDKAGAAEDTTAAADQYSILAADDDLASLTVLLNVLRNEGYYVKAATNGEDVLKELENRREYDLVIMDVMMPKLSGYEALKRIRQQFQALDLPILLLTAKARPECLQAGFEAGANDYLPKPFDVIELKARVKTLVELKKSVGTRVETELSFLQAQIKPHFLYNALSVIAALSTEKPRRTEELLYDLSDYLRGSFDFQNYRGVTLLSRELATIRAYVSIEKERFQNKLAVTMDIDETIDTYVPVLAVQPLVENAIRHGVMKKQEGGQVTLSVKQEEGFTVITVEDDGVGIPEEKLAGLLNGPGAVSGVGVANIQRRMILYYGQGLEIRSAEGQGTSVCMKIPDQRG